MALTLILTRTGIGLIPADPYSAEAIKALQIGKQFKASVTAPRRIRHHRLAFALMQAVYESQTVYTTFEQMFDAIKIALGFYDLYDLHGRQVFRLRSIAWHNMDQKQFSEWYDKMLAFILEKVIPNTRKADLEARVYDILGERGPQQMEKYDVV